MARFDPDLAVVHANVAVLACDSAATLEETLALLADLDLRCKRVGDSSLLFVASDVPVVQAALRRGSRFPRVVGDGVWEEEGVVGDEDGKRAADGEREDL